jgi:phosphonate transport system substrate-binding protein
MATKTAKVELKIGAVAYAPKVITIWEGMREYLRGQGLMTEYVLYSSYPALVDALVAGHIDIAWNTPLAYLQAKERLGGQCLVLGMRDSDMGFSTVFIARADSSIHSLGDLKGTRFALGSRDSSHAAILPVHFLRAAGLEPDKDMKLVRSTLTSENTATQEAVSRTWSAPSWKVRRTPAR